MTDSAFLRLKDISKIYQMGENKLYALNQVNLAVEKGDFVVILGPSGSGKSTLLNILGGTDRPTSGEFLFQGRDLTKINDHDLTLYRRNEVGFIFQFYNLLPTLTALENVEVATEISKNPMDPREALKIVELADYADHFPAQMSGGQQQRVAIARALASNPSIFLCDEPTGALDTKTSQVILELLIKLCETMHKTILFVTHNREFAKLGHRVIELKDGKIVKQ